MKLKTASLTTEAKAVPLTILKMTTPRASLGGISRINGLDYHTSHLPLILQELPQLVESPRVEITPLCFPMFGRLPNTSEVFDSNCWLGVFQSFINNSLRDTMIGIGLKPLLFTTKAFQGASCTPRPFSLKALTNSPIVMFSVLNFTPTKELSSRGNSYKTLPHITTNNCGDIFKLRSFDCLRERHIKEDTILAFDEGGCSYIPTISKILSLMSTKSIRHLNSPLNSRDAYCLAFWNKPEVSSSNATFKKDAGGLESSQMPFAIGLHRGIGSGNLSDGRASHLCREREASTNILVDKPMQGNTSGKAVIIKGYLAHIITSLSKAINRFPQCLRRVNQLQRYCASSFTFHQRLIYHILSGMSSLTKEVSDNSPVT